MRFLSNKEEMTWVYNKPIDEILQKYSNKYEGRYKFSQAKEERIL